MSFPTDPNITSIADDPTGVNVTKVKVAHITELRTAVNAVRTLAGQAGAQWTNQTLTAAVTFISADDVRDLRTKLDEALLALGIQTSNYDDQTLAGAPNGTVIKKVHITQLRQRSTSGIGGAGGGSPNQFGVQWLVADQLGTPRMVFDETGSLSNVKRHDYLPFGEDLVAGGRATTPGYGAADGVRQKFTGYERDGETNLDFAQARYHSNVQGRFTSPDPFIPSIDPGQPQTMNRYSYVINNPLNLTDPLGLKYFEGGGTAETNLQDGEPKLPVNIQTLPDSDFQFVITRINLEQDSGRYLSDGEAAAKTLRKMGGTSSLSEAFEESSKTEGRFEDRSGGITAPLTAAGIASGVGEHYHVNGDFWRGLNGKRYPMSWGGNASTGGRSVAKLTAKGFRLFGRFAFFVSLADNGYQAYQGNITKTKAGVNIGFAAVGTVGGPWGLAASIVYSVVDMTVGWERVLENAHPPRQEDHVGNMF